MNPEKLPFSKQLAYACGMMGWSVMINLISVILIYFYLPPSDSGLPTFITQAAVFGFSNAIAIITSSGRIVDAIYDPFIAQFSDASKNPKGRRIPLMKLAVLPSFIFCSLVFYPLEMQESSSNIIWLVITLVLFYISSTTYIIPYSALLPEMAHSSEDKVRLSTWQSVGYVFGIAIASNTFNISTVMQGLMDLDRVHGMQYSIFILALLGALFMYIPVLAINEKKYCVSKPHAVPMRMALKQSLSNKNFRRFLFADFSYFMSVTIITSGLMYFVKVLLRLEEKIGNSLMMTMVLVSFLFYPAVIYLSKKAGKKILVIFSLVLLAFVFLGISFLGMEGIAAEVQIYTLVCFAAIPLASLNILPAAILAEIIEKDTLDTGSNKEGIYFAVRYFFIKISQTFGIAVFATLLLYGKDPGDDAGIRMNAIIGCVLCLLAAVVFGRFREK